MTMSVMDWLTLIVAIVSAAVTGGVSYGLQRGRIESLEKRADRQERRIDHLFNGRGHQVDD